jgi:hypothetical protein
MRLLPYRLAPDSHPYLIERLRVMYNEAIPYLTHSLTEHTAESQLLWWAGLDHSKVTIHLYAFSEKPWVIMGFSMLTDRGKYFSTMHAVAEEYRGVGFGGEIMDHSYSIVRGTPLCSASLTENRAVMRWNAVKGWCFYEARNGVSYMFLPNGTDWTESEYVEIITDYMSRHGD